MNILCPASMSRTRAPAFHQRQFLVTKQAAYITITPSITTDMIHHRACLYHMSPMVTTIQHNHATTSEEKNRMSLSHSTQDELFVNETKLPNDARALRGILVLSYCSRTMRRSQPPPCIINNHHALYSNASHQYQD